MTNKPGFDLKLAVENPSFMRSIIQAIGLDGTIINEIPWTPTTHHMYNPQPDPRHQQPYKIKLETGEIEIPSIIPEDSVTTGENPFIQLIHRFVKKQSRISEDITRHLLHEKKVLADDKFSKKKIEVFVNEMYSGPELAGLLIRRGDEYLAGLSLKTGRRIIKLNLGYDPFEYEIISFAERKGTISRNEIYQLLSVSGNRYKWARSDGTVTYYIDKLLEQENIIQVGEDWYRYKNYPKRMS